MGETKDWYLWHEPYADPHSPLSRRAGIVPASCGTGVLGNITDADVRRSIEALPQLCAAGATVIWTRHRRPPDRTPVIRKWLQATGFNETAFHAPDDVLFSVGVDTFVGEPEPLRLGRMFRFIA